MGKTVITALGLFVGLATLAVLVSPNGDKLVRDFFGGTNTLFRTATAPAR